MDRLILSASNANSVSAMLRTIGRLPESEVVALTSALSGEGILGRNLQGMRFDDETPIRTALLTRDLKLQVDREWELSEREQTAVQAIRSVLSSYAKQWGIIHWDGNVTLTTGPRLRHSDLAD